MKSLSLLCKTIPWNYHVLGIEVDEQNPISVRDPKSFHITQAALDLNSLPSDEIDHQTQLWVRVKHQNQLLLTLNRHHPQVKLDLAFAASEKVKFSVANSGTVYITGYYIPEEDESGGKIPQANEMVNTEQIKHMQKYFFVFFM